MRGFLKAPLFLDFDLVPEMGLEPIWIAPFDFKSNAYTNSATRALFNYIIKQAIKKSPWLKARGGEGRRRTGSSPACGGDHFSSARRRRMLHCLGGRNTKQWQQLTWVT